MPTLVIALFLPACATVPASDSPLADALSPNCGQVLVRDETNWCFSREPGTRFFLARQSAGGIPVLSEALPIPRIELPAMVETLEYGFDSLWLSYAGWPMGVLRIDPQTLVVQASIEVGTGELSRSGSKGEIAVGQKTVWAISNGFLSGIDPASNLIVSQFVVPYGAPISIATGDGVIWLAHADGVLEIDEDTSNLIQNIPLPAGTHISTRLTGWGHASRIAVSGQTVRVPLAETRTGFLSCRANCYPTLVGTLDRDSGRFVAEGN